MSSFWIEVEQNGVVQTYPFENKNSVSFGRDRMADFVLDHPTVSRQHGLILHDPRSGYRLMVMSKGGMTAVDGSKVMGEVPLYDGSVLHFGQISVVFRSHGALPKPGAGSFAQGGFGAASLEEPVGQPASLGQPRGGFGAAPATQAFASSPQSSSSGGFGGFDAPPTGDAQGASIGGDAANVWDEIAAQAEAEQIDMGLAEDVAVSDYERMQEASSKAKKASEGVNPVLIAACVIAVGFMLYTLMMPEPTVHGPIAEQEVNPTEVEMKVTVDCLGKDVCLEQAVTAFNIGKQQYEKKDTRVANLFESYKNMLKAQAALKQANLEAPAELSGLDAQKTQARAELISIFRRYRANFVNKQKYKMSQDMLEALLHIKMWFPDKVSPEYQWTERRELEMKVHGTYPATSQ